MLEAPILAGSRARLIKGADRPPLPPERGVNDCRRCVLAAGVQNKFGGKKKVCFAPASEGLRKWWAEGGLLAQVSDCVCAVPAPTGSQSAILTGSAQPGPACFVQGASPCPAVRRLLLHNPRDSWRDPLGKASPPPQFSKRETKAQGEEGRHPWPVFSAAKPRFASPSAGRSPPATDLHTSRPFPGGRVEGKGQLPPQGWSQAPPVSPKPPETDVSLSSREEQDSVHAETGLGLHHGAQTPGFFL